ncbi:hypothetical protein CHS0354_020770 [Potamilus streckersoni]|uniref:Phosphatidylinositide phosphatase SAC2 n=1 Tax=Potamilus streckersoni TaxID=2493646 RepID=A0AAE0SDP6_9BIVA|nr:hypothetical protein CHS0354_020770 [Potamilus streckersoni]
MFNECDMITNNQKDERGTHEAFCHHMDEQLGLYRSVTVISLAELSGKEKVIGDAFLNHVLEYNSPDVTFVTFDFHEYCRGMKFENVNILTDGIKDIIKHMRYCWVDRKGVICEQRGVFRVNCIDCLDRTNVVQTTIARIIMETQCRKLGLLAPDESLPLNCRIIYQQMWANNGDAISQQYAGTVALKGDYTRTGERRLTGMMKDGVNSASRYYLRFKDAYRQAAINLTLGQPVSDDLLTLGPKVQEEDDRDLVEKEENVKMLIEDCKKMLIVEPEECLGGWSLVDADPVTGDPDRQEMDTILLLSQRAVYVAWYDDEEEKVTSYQRIFLEDLEKLEIGAEPAFFKSKYICMRLYYRNFADERFFHTLRTPATRLFNNIVITINNQEEAKESLKAIGQAFIAAQTILSLKLEVEDRPKLERKKTQPHPDVHNIHHEIHEHSLSGIRLPRDISTDISPQSTSRNASPVPDRKMSPVPARRETSQVTKTLSFPKLEMEGKESIPEKPSSLTTRSSSSEGYGKKIMASIQAPMNILNKNISVPKFNVKPIMKKLSKGSTSKLLSVGRNVFYSSAGKTGEDNAQVIQGKIIRQPPVEQQRPLSHKNYLVEEVPSIEEQDDKKEVLLDSCGILATSSKQILNSPQISIEEIEDSASGGITPGELTDEVSNETSSKDSNSSLVSANQSENVLDLQETGQTVKNMTEPTDTDRNLNAVTYTLSDSDLSLPPTAGKEPDFIKTSEKVMEISEADKILAKYANHRKRSLSNPVMKTSLSDGALVIHVENESTIKMALNSDFLINSELHAKGAIKNLLERVTMPRKIQRVYDTLKQQIHEKLGERECLTTIIFI